MVLRRESTTYTRILIIFKLLRTGIHCLLVSTLSRVAVDIENPFYSSAMAFQFVESDTLRIGQLNQNILECIFEKCNDIKIKLYCPELEATGNGGCQGLTIKSITLNTGHDCFYNTDSLSFTHLVYLYTLGPFETQKLELELVAISGSFCCELY